MVDLFPGLTPYTATKLSITEIMHIFNSTLIAMHRLRIL